MGKTLVETIDLKKYFKTPKGMLHAVDGINLKINEGETLGVVGESGCGKSTLGRTILRLIEPSSGQILYDNKNILDYKGRELKQIRTKMQMIFQDPFTSLNPRFSVSQCISDPMKMCNITKNKAELRERTEQLMEEVGLPKRYINTYPHEMDGGRRQRVGLARALAVNPAFIVCDEPVSALDVSIQAQILNLLMDLQEQKNIAYMFITHDLCVVRHISKNIAVMYMGQVVEYAPRDELFSHRLHPYTQALLAAIPLPVIGTKHQEKYILSGEVANPINPQEGCRFANRCPYATEKCKEPQILKEVTAGHYVACAQY